MIASELAFIFLRKHGLKFTETTAASETANRIIPQQSAAWVRKNLGLVSSTKALSALLGRYTRHRTPQKGSPIRHEDPSAFFSVVGSAHVPDLSPGLPPPVLAIHKGDILSVDPEIHSLPTDEEEGGNEPPPRERHRVKVRVTVVEANSVQFVDQLLSAVDPYCRLCFRNEVHDTEVKSGQSPVWNEAFNFVFEEPGEGRKLAIWMGDQDDDDVWNGSGPPSHVIATLEVDLPNREGTMQQRYEMVAAQGKSGVGMLAAPWITLKYETAVEILPFDE
jgi:hypothetical protein